MNKKESKLLDRLWTEIEQSETMENLSNYLSLYDRFLDLVIKRKDANI